MFGSSWSQAQPSTSTFGASAVQSQATGLSGNDEAQRSIMEASQRLQHTKQMRSSDFLAYSYVVADNPSQITQVLSQPFNAAVHGDPLRWQAAKSQNPDVSVAYPKPLIGFRQLEERAQQQKAAMESLVALAEQAKSQFTSLKSQMRTSTLIELEKARTTQQSLFAQLLKVSREVEMAAVRNARASSDPVKSRLLHSSLEAIQSHATQIARKISALSVGLKSLKKSVQDRRKLDQGGILDFEEARQSVESRAIEKLQKIADQKYAENIKQKLDSQVYSIFKDFLENPASISRPALSGPSLLCPPNELELIDLLSRYPLSGPLVLRIGALSSESLSLRRLQDDAKEIWSAIACLVDGGGSIKYLENRFASGLLKAASDGGFSGTGNWDTICWLGAIRFDDKQFPVSEEHTWFALFTAIRAGWWMLVEEFATGNRFDYLIQRFPGLRDVSKALLSRKNKQLTDRVVVSALPAISAQHVTLPALPFAESRTLSVDTIALPSVQNVCCAEQEALIAIVANKSFAISKLYGSTAEDWLWLGLQSSDKEKLRARLENLPADHFGPEGGLQAAKLKFLVNDFSQALLSISELEPALAAHISIVVSKGKLVCQNSTTEDYPLSEEETILGTCVLKHVKAFPIEDQLKFFALLPERVRAWLLEEAMMENKGCNEDLSGWINSEGVVRPGLLEKSMSNRPDEFRHIAVKAAKEAAKRAKYSAAIRLMYIAGDGAGLIDMIARSKNLLGSSVNKAGISKGALDFESLKTDVVLFERLANSNSFSRWH